MKKFIKFNTKKLNEIFNIDSPPEVLYNEYDACSGYEGEYNPFYGKKHSEEIMKKIKYKLSKDYGFISPENKVIKGRNLVDFCKQMKLSYDSMYLILKGKQSVYKGWRLA